MKILFVCTGNICRSAAAAGMWTKMAGARGLAIPADSAGTVAEWDRPAHPDTMEAATQLGYDLASHRSKPVYNELLKEPMLILGMAERHVTWLRGLRPDLTARVHLFRLYCEGREEETSRSAAEDIADPIGHPLAFHRRCVGDIQQLLEKLAMRMTESSVR